MHWRAVLGLLTWIEPSRSHAPPGTTDLMNTLFCVRACERPPGNQDARRGQRAGAPARRRVQLPAGADFPTLAPRAHPGETRVSLASAAAPGYAAGTHTPGLRHPANPGPGLAASAARCLQGSAGDESRRAGMACGEGAGAGFPRACTTCQPGVGLRDIRPRARQRGRTRLHGSARTRAAASRAHRVSRGSAAQRNARACVEQARRGGGRRRGAGARQADAARSACRAPCGRKAHRRTPRAHPCVLRLPLQHATARRPSFES